MKNWKWKEQNEEWRVKQYKRLEKNDSRRLKYPLSWKTIKMSFIIQYQDVWALFPKCWDDECLKRQKKRHDVENANSRKRSSLKK